MGVINLTPDSFSDGGKYNKKNLGFERASYLIKKGCSAMSKEVNPINYLCIFEVTH